MSNLSVIIPSRNRSNLAKCIRAIRNADETCMIIIVDDGMEPWPNPPEELEPLALRAGTKPFVFARNITSASSWPRERTWSSLNDDALLQAPGGFTLQHRTAAEYGFIAAACNVHPQKREIWAAFEKKSGHKIGHTARKQSLKVVGSEEIDNG